MGLETIKTKEDKHRASQPDGPEGDNGFIDSTLVSELLKNRSKIELKSCQNSSKIYQKLIESQSKIESWRDLGPSRGPSERPGGLGIDFCSIWGSISGPIFQL